MGRETFKELLRTIKDNDYKVPEGTKPFDLALEMMNYLGDADGELRDILALSVLTNWIINDILTIEEIHKILNISLDEKHLLYGLGRTDDTVFARTFSVLIVESAVYKHRSNSYLSKEEISKILNKVIKLYNEDKDVRGYIEGKGWAHGAAHGADTLGELARCEEVGYEDLKRILDAVHKKVNIGYYGYIHEEDERMMTAVSAVLERKLIPEPEIIEWIKSFEEIIKIGQYPYDLIIQVNVKSFLRSLYFRLIGNSEYGNVINETKEILENMSKYR
jgi:hypothetical protein